MSESKEGMLLAVFVISSALVAVIAAIVLSALRKGLI